MCSLFHSADGEPEAQRGRNDLPKAGHRADW